MTTPSVAAVIGARIARNRRKIFDAFRAHTATTVSNAKRLDELGVTDSTLFRIQVKRKIIVHIQNETYYLDEAREKEIDRLRHQILAGVILMFLIFLLVMVLIKL